MVSMEQLKVEFDKRNYRYFGQFTTGNYDDKGEIIDKKIPTLTTEYCEIGFDGQLIYLVFIAQSDSWSKEFFEEIKKFQNIKIYGFNQFLKDYNLAKNPALEIKSEPYFQMQFNLRNDNDFTETELLNKYDLIIKLFKDFRIQIVDQLKKKIVFK